jgi:alkylated DNA repair dioxygenase AlkB
VGPVANVRSASPVTDLELRWQPTLLSAVGDAPAFDPWFAGARHLALDEGAWVEHVGGWVQGTDALFEQIVAIAPWEHRTVHMYDRVVEEPRLTAWYGRALDDPSLPSIISAMATALSRRYHRAFDSVGAALYRDGRDSVAWHGDRIAKTLVEPVVAILSLGSERTLRLRPKGGRKEGGGNATSPFRLIPGDLFVMGGTMQATWQHSVPKVANAGARISLQFRHST